MSVNSFSVDAGVSRRLSCSSNQKAWQPGQASIPTVVPLWPSRLMASIACVQKPHAVSAASRVLCVMPVLEENGASPVYRDFLRAPLDPCERTL